MRPLPATRACLAAALAAGLGACAAPGGPRPRGGQTTCREDALGYEVTYPAAWYSDGCRRFDPAPIDDVLLAKEAAITFGTERTDLEGYVRQLAGPAQDVVDRKRVEVAGRSALRLRMRATRDARLVPPGTLTTEYVIDLKGSVLVARAAGRPGTAFDAAEDVLDRMVFTLKVDQGVSSSSRIP